MNVSSSILPSHRKGTDDIDPCIATASIANIAPILPEMIYCSFTTGVVHQATKIAKVLAIFLKEKDAITNYRLFLCSVLFFSKFYEKLMYNRLYNFTEKSDILFHSQHGFQPGRVPFMSLLSRQDKISNAFENNEFW